MSGGLLDLTINNGQITAGAEAGAELVMSLVAGNANIVDNAGGAVNVMYPYGGRLDGVNRYSGSTTLNGRELCVLSPVAPPTGTELALKGGELRFGLDAPATFLVDQFVLRGSATAHDGGYAKLQPIEAILKEGKLGQLELVGNGELVKQGHGTVTVFGQSRDFSGNVIVRERVLEVQSERALGTGTIEIEGGIFAATCSSSSGEVFPYPIRLIAGTPAIGDNDFTGPVSVEAESVLSAEFSPYPLNAGARLNGPISGDGNLTIESGPVNERTNVIELRGNNADFHGHVMINGRTLRVGRNSTLGTGDVSIGPAGRLELENNITAHYRQRRRAVFQGGFRDVDRSRDHR